MRKGYWVMKKLLIAIGILVLVVVAVAIAAPFFIPVDTVKSKVVEQVKTSTGRDLVIAGKVSLSILPSFSVEANDVSLSNAPGAASKDMVKLDQLKIGLQLLPLLSGKVALDSFVLVKPVIALEVDKQGKPNWEFTTGSGKPAPVTEAAKPNAPAAPASSGGNSISELQLGDVRLDNGTISYQDDRTGQKYLISGINMKVSLPDLDHKFEASGKATYNGKELDLDVTLASPRQAIANKPSDFKLTLGGDVIKLSVVGSLAGGPPLKVGGTVDLDIPSVRGLATWAGKPLPASGGPLGPLSISGKLALEGSKMSFTEAKLGLDAIKGTGELAVDTGGTKPVVRAKLALDKLDVNPYLPPDPPPGAAPAASPAAASAGQKGWSTEPIDFSALNAAEADLGLSFNSLIFKKFEIDKGAMTVALHEAHLDVELVQLALYQGTGVGKVIVDAKATPTIQSSFKLDKVQLNPIVKAAGIGDWISGTANMDFDVATTGRSQKDFVGALNGKGSIAVNSGSISGIDIGALVSNPVKAIEEQSTKSGKTDFASLTGTYTITSGIVKNTDLAMSSPVFQLAGTGTVNLPPQTVDYVISPKLSVGSKGPGLSIPVKVSGPWNNLSYTPDASGLLNSPGAAANAVKGLLGGSKGTGTTGTTKSSPADALKGLLGH